MPGWPRSCTRRRAPSSAIPEHNPVTEATPGHPLESYGRAKLYAESLCHEAAAAGLDVSIIRPRTILGHGRLGIMAILFEFVAEGTPVFVLGGGHNRYQFVHAGDLADACLRAAEPSGTSPPTTSVPPIRPPCARPSRRSSTTPAPARRSAPLPTGPAATAMKTLAGMGLIPLAPYHWLLYGESLWFDTTKAETELGWASTSSNEAMLIESYEWFLAHRSTLGEGHGSHHQSPVPLGVLKLLKRLP